MGAIGEAAADPTWSVVCTTIEPAALVEAFAAHHLALGAARVFVFLDDPSDAAAFDLDPAGPVAVVPCDAAHWAARSGGRPADHRLRQCHNAEVAARTLARTDWIAHLDADEFLWPRAGRGIAALLRDVSPDIGAARVRPAERMFVAGWDEAGLDLGGAFKLGGEEATLGRRLYGDRLGAAFPKGFQGHDLGKSFRRTARSDLRFRIHRAFQGKVEAPAHQVPRREAVLLHLFPASFQDWTAKYRRRLAAPEVMAAMTPRERRKYEFYRETVAAEGPAGARALFERLSVLSDGQARDLMAEGLAIAPRLPGREEVRTALAPLRVARPFQATHGRAGGSLGPRAILVGQEPCGDRDICRMAAARGWSYAHLDQGRIAPPAGGVDLLAGIGLDADVARLAAGWPGAVLILNHRPVAAWLAEGPAADRLAWGLAWDRRLAAVTALARAGAPVIEWAVELDKPSHLLARIEAARR